MAIKLFELDKSVRESAKQLGLAYNTIYHLYQIFRLAIIITDSDNGSFSDDIEMDESNFWGREKETGVGELPGKSQDSSPMDSNTDVLTTVKSSLKVKFTSMRSKVSGPLPKNG